MIDWTKLKTKQDIIDDGIDLVWESIKKKRDACKYAGVFVSGNWFHSDAESRIQWMALKDTGREMIDSGSDMNEVIRLKGVEVLWKTLTGNFVPVTIQLSFDVNQAVKELDALAFATAEYHSAAMRQTQDPLSYNFETGWPATL